MKLTHLWPFGVVGLIIAYTQISHNALFTTLGSLTNSRPVSPEDSAVRYTVADLKVDTTLFTQPRPVATLTDASLVEASGLAPSPTSPGYLWTQEDSGNANQIQLLTKTGDVSARYILDGLINRDWEDIATGPGPVAGKSYVYVAEIGDNDFKYAQKIIYRFIEPTITGKKLPVTEHITSVDALRFKLPDGPQNAEAFLLDPLTKDLFIFSKGNYSTVYRASYPQPVNQPTMMTRVLTLPFEKVTAASVSSDGSEILLRTYKKLVYYKRHSRESVVDALKREPLLIPLADEPQGEAVCWAGDGSGYYTTSERTFFTTQKLYFYQRKK
ncbi:hypothetical protein [Spirosoma fluviale]|uniref:WD40-like Beta Propeller Repeat n=1 Tax=Spirosoma fluviale TaxID=1597977 RepID=A0A286F9C5_9BACT|nr:hypothetical protein [Spirosoma fluviale]SOD79686.1 hypothetical protein SAMN06269250_1054 [Spirosoma fluviale]